MYLREEANIIELLKTVEMCAGEVYYCTLDGDRLNLKSVLCRYFFAIVANCKSLQGRSWIECDEKADEQLLAEFLISKEDSV
jgi:hypothetical protein